MRAWEADELAWARECLAAGDTLEEIAEWCEPRRTVEDVAAALAVDLDARMRRRADPRWLEIERLWNLDYGCRHIGPRVGLAPARVNQIIIKMRELGFNVPARPRGVRGTHTPVKTPRPGPPPKNAARDAEIVRLREDEKLTHGAITRRLKLPKRSIVPAVMYRHREKLRREGRSA